jgi:hypothetical protein
MSCVSANEDVGNSLCQRNTPLRRTEKTTENLDIINLTANTSAENVTLIRLFIAIEAYNFDTGKLLVMASK